MANFVIQSSGLPMDDDSNDSDEELKILMTKIQDDIYDPLGSLTTLNGTVSSLEKSNDSTTHQEEKKKNRFKTKVLDSERSSNGNENEKGGSKINRIIIDDKLLAGLTPEPRKPSPYNSNAYAVYTSIPRNSSTEARHSKQNGGTSATLINKIGKDSSGSMPLTNESTSLRTYDNLITDGELLVNVTPKPGKRGDQTNEYIDDTSEEISDGNVVAEANRDDSENKVKDKNTENNTSVTNLSIEKRSTIPKAEKLQPASSPQENADELDTKIRDGTPSPSSAKKNSKDNCSDKPDDGLHESNAVLTLDRSDTSRLNSTERRPTNVVEEGTENNFGKESSASHGDITNKTSPACSDENNRILPENDEDSVSSCKGSPSHPRSPANERNSQENVSSEKNVGVAPFVNNISPNHDKSVSSSPKYAASNSSSLTNIDSNISSPKKNPSAIDSLTNIDSPTLSAVNGKDSSLSQNDNLSKSFVSISNDEVDKIRNEGVDENDEISDKNSVESNRDENNSTRNSNKKGDESELSSIRKSDDYEEYIGNKSDLELNLGDNDSLTNYSDSDPESDAPKKPKWHPPWQLNQVTLLKPYYQKLREICSKLSGKRLGETLEASNSPLVYLQLTLNKSHI